MSRGGEADGRSLAERAAEALAGRLPDRPELLLILGSGLGHVADAVDDAVVIPFEDLPGFPAPSVAGHAGRYVSGRLEGRRVLVQQGRYHVYEGYPPEVVSLPVRTARAVGIQSMIVTNAAGGIRRDLGPGSIVLLDDHINLQFISPLTGPLRGGEQRFPDMSAPYDPGWMARAESVALSLGIPLSRGVYVAVTGPSYETPAEVRMLERMGADVVGMSTVPEVIVARAGGMRCLAFSLVTNPAAGRTTRPLDHAEVMEVGRRAGATLERLLRGVVAFPEGV
jgi:purine-nucleoside phosphorylase